MRWLPILRIKALAWQAEPLAAIISLQFLQTALNILGYPAVTIFIMIESSGIPFPGETMLLLASFYAAVDNQLKIPIVIACAALGAIVGDNIGYYAGRTGGRALAERFGKYLFLKPRHLARAEKFFAKHGDKTVFFGRFIAILRAWAAFLAGVNRMPWHTFLIFNATGGITWAIIYGLLGYFVGRLFQNNFNEVERIARALGWLGAGALAAAVLIAVIILRRRRSRQSRSIPKTNEQQREEFPEEEEAAQPSD